MDFWGYLPAFWEAVKKTGEDTYNYLDSLIPDNWKSHEGDPGYWDVGDTDPEVDILPYIPGVDTVQQMENSQRYWKDYKKNTGFSPRYPGMAVHTPNVAQTVNSFDWWLP